jgi:hypothetical protein
MNQKSLKQAARLAVSKTRPRNSQCNAGHSVSYHCGLVQNDILSVQLTFQADLQ